MNFGMDRQIQEVCSEVSKVTQQFMLEQLSELVSRGLLRWEEGPMQLVMERHPGAKLKIACSGKFVLREDEYIKELELQNAQLRAAMNIGIPKEKRFP